MIVNKVCSIAVQSSGSSVAPYILGDVFMRNFYITIDYNKT